MKMKSFNAALLSVLLFATLSFSVYGYVNNLYYVQAFSISAETSKVILGQGTAGSSTIYTNSTSAKASVTAPEPNVTTYNPDSYSILNGTYVSGSVPTSVQSVDTDYFIVESSESATSTSGYNPSGYNLLGNTTYVSGALSDLQTNDSVYMQFRSYATATSPQTLYAHQETTTIGGATYRLQKLESADSGGVTLAADIGSPGRKLLDKFAYPLTGVSHIPASTWTFYYRVNRDTGAGDVYCDVDILIRQANGSIRQTIATDVAQSAEITSEWTTLSATYSWSGYTVVDQTDYLEIDYYMDVWISSPGGGYAYLRIDDNTLPIADQTRITNIYLPSQFTVEVEFTGTSNTASWTHLVWTIDSAFTTAGVTTTFQLYNYSSGSYSTSGDGYMNETMGTTDVTKTQNITTNPTDFRDNSGNWKIKITGVKNTTSQFDFKVDLTEFEPTYWSEYTVSTEFLFSNMTTETPIQLNFTVVSEYDVDSVNVTIQVWNYSSSAYVTSGQGYLFYTSAGANETKLLSIDENPHFYASNGSAKIKITAVKSTISQFNQKINQIKLDYCYSSQATYDYILKIDNQVSDSWKIRLRAYNESNIGRLFNCTIYFYNGDGVSRHIYVLDGAYSQQYGNWYNLNGLGVVYIAMAVSASTAGTSYIYAFLEVLIPNTSTYNLMIITFEIS
jgi:hypothetical protein